MVMSLYIAGSRPWRPKPRLPSRAEHAVDVDSRRNWHWPSSSPSDSHRQVLEMYQEQPGTETDQNSGPFVDYQVIFFFVRLVVTMWPAASASLAAT